MQGLMDLGGGVGFFGTLFIGALAGWIAEKTTGSNHGLITNVIVGIAGAYIGAFLANALGVRLGEIFSGWFWGKMGGRFVVVFAPVFVAMMGAMAWGAAQGIAIPWHEVLVYTGFLLSLAWCFLGIAMLLSTLARSSDVAQGAAFLVWLTLLLFLDLILLGLMIQEQAPPESVVALALANPLQVFRTASMLLFDPQLVLLGPAAYVILDHFGRFGYLLWAFAYPLVVGTLCAVLGYQLFRRSDLP